MQVSDKQDTLVIIKLKTGTVLRGMTPPPQVIQGRNKIRQNCEYYAFI